MSSKKALPSNRCGWVSADEIYIRYHDEEWGVPVRDDHQLFEFLVLEGAQAGLSWLTVLKKRENYRKAFQDFDIDKVAAYTEEDVEALMANPGLIRNRLKLTSAVSNARAAQAVREEAGSLSDYLWSFVGGEPLVNRWETLADVPATTPLSDELSKALRKRGFRFVGSTICYSFLQATGMVMDHVTTCFRYAELASPSGK